MRRSESVMGIYFLFYFRVAAFYIFASDGLPVSCNNATVSRKQISVIEDVFYR